MNNVPKQIRILIADDHAIVRHGLKLSLSQEPDFIVVGEAADGQEALMHVFDLVPDIVLLDWKMPRLDGVAAARQIKHHMATVRTLLLSGAPIEAAALDALDDGVDGFVHKDIGPNELSSAIRKVATGGKYLSPDVTEALIQRSRQLRIQEEVSRPSLSNREKQVLALMATAATYREIAKQLVISEETVRTYVKRIMAKLKQSNRTQTVIEALRLGYISIDK